MMIDRCALGTFINSTGRRRQEARVTRRPSDDFQASSKQKRRSCSLAARSYVSFSVSFRFFFLRLILVSLVSLSREQLALFAAAGADMFPSIGPLAR